jgi:XTP/dITP diphosphohydrolase
MELAVATGNQGKLAEIRALLEPMGHTVRSAAELGFGREVEETGDTFAENARLKACAVARELGRPALADDSGLEVEALAGRPGVLSARYAGPGATPAQRNAKLLEELAGLDPDRRGAAFVCVMCLCLPSGETLFAEGRLAGRIAQAPAGQRGFGYDPVFELPERGLTVAQISPEDKNAISHRGRALRRLAAELDSFLERAG